MVSLVLFCDMSIVYSLKPALRPKGECDIDLEKDIVVLNYKGLNCSTNVDSWTSPNVYPLQTPAHVNDENIGQLTGRPVMGFALDGETCYGGSISHPSLTTVINETSGTQHLDTQICPHSKAPDRSIVRWREFDEWPTDKPTGDPTQTARIFTQCDAVNGAVSKSYGLGASNCDGEAIDTTDNTIFWGMKGTVADTGREILADEGIPVGECVNSWGSLVTGFDYSYKMYCPGTLSEIPSVFLHSMRDDAATCCPARNITNTCNCHDYYNAANAASIQWFDEVAAPGCLDENVYNQPNSFAWFPDVAGLCINLGADEYSNPRNWNIPQSMEWVSCEVGGSVSMRLYRDNDCVGTYELVDALDNECFNDRFIVRCAKTNNTLWNAQSECYQTPVYEEVLDGDGTTNSTITGTTNSTAATAAATNSTDSVSTASATTTTVVTTMAPESTETTSTTLTVTIEDSDSDSESVTDVTTAAPASSAFVTRNSFVGVLALALQSRRNSMVGLATLGAMLIGSAKGLNMTYRLPKMDTYKSGLFKAYGYRPFDLCEYDPSTDYLEISHHADKCTCGALDLAHSNIGIIRKDLEIVTYKEAVDMFSDVTGGCQKIVGCDAQLGVLASYWHQEETCEGELTGDDDIDSLPWSLWWKDTDSRWGKFTNSSWMHESSSLASLGGVAVDDDNVETPSQNAPCKDMGCKINNCGCSVCTGHAKSSRELSSSSYWCELGKRPSWLVSSHTDYEPQYGCSGAPSTNFPVDYDYQEDIMWGANFTATCANYDVSIHASVTTYVYADCWAGSYSNFLYFEPQKCVWSGFSWDWKSFIVKCVTPATNSHQRVEVEWFNDETCDASRRGVPRFALDFVSVNKRETREPQFATYPEMVCSALGIDFEITLNKWGSYNDEQGVNVYTCPGTAAPYCDDNQEGQFRSNFTGFTEKVKYPI